MVLKRGKNGVATGNTLRSNAHRRGYAKEGVLTKSILPRRQKAGDPDDNTLEAREGYVAERLGCKPITALDDGLKTNGPWWDVEYSLNKRGRWNLPNMLKERVKDSTAWFQDPCRDELNDECDITLVESHKLSKSSSCINVTSTSLESGSYSSKSRKYFNYNSFVGSKEAEKRKAAAAREVEGLEQIEELEKPEVFYQVFYPSPATSELSHNPKYSTHQSSSLVYNESGRSSRQRRRGAKLRRIDVWEGAEDIDLVDDDSFQETLQWSYDDHAADYSSEMDCTATSNASLEEFLVPTRQKKSKTTSKKAKRKNRNVGLDVLDTSEEIMKGTVLIQGEAMRGISLETVSTMTDLNQDNPSATTTSEVLRYVPEMSAVIIKMTKCDTDAEHLRRELNVPVRQTNTTPCRLVLDITENVREMTGNSVLDDRQLESYVIMDPACLSTGEDIVNVRLDIQSGLLGIRDVDCLESGQTYTPTAMVQAVVGFLVKDVTGRDLEVLAEPGSQQTMGATPIRTTGHTTSDFGLINSLLGWEVRSMLPQDAFDAIKDNTLAKVCEPTGIEESTLSETQLGDGSCNICFGEGFETSGDGFPCVTALLPCGHVFCNECWMMHLMLEMRRRNAVVRCPGYKCNNPVDIQTILYFIGLANYRRHLETLENVTLQTNRDVIYCPNNYCRRVLLLKRLDDVRGRYDRDEAAAINARCHCGRKLCTQCQDEPHWPLSCEEYKQYTQKLKYYGDYNIEHTMLSPLDYVARVKRCPHCGHPMEKNAGCNYMFCICQRAFCWMCLRPWHTSLNHYHCRDNLSSHESMVLHYIDRRNMKAGARGELYTRAVEYRLMRSTYSFKQLAFKILNRWAKMEVGQWQ